MTTPLKLYALIIKYAKPALKWVLESRLQNGKEDFDRMGERMGVPSRPRPDGHLIWIHAASVGEAQSALILITKIHDKNPNSHIMVTTGTMTSAALMEQRLPPHAFHQFIPLDHPEWVDNFLNHWSPNLAIWMESELWPNMVMGLKQRDISIILMNARLSDKSFSFWKRVPKTIAAILSCFDMTLAQTKQDADRFQRLGAGNVRVTDNLKYAAAPLPYDAHALNELKAATDNRALWVYASTHDGEEDLACAIHLKIKKIIPNLLTIIVPRHPERRYEIETVCQKAGVRYSVRSNKNTPSPHDDVYIADTMGELGLFYALSPIAVIGRSFSSDGGGGHNPLEAAQMGCVVLTGPNNQFQRALYDDMARHDVVIKAKTKEELYLALKDIFMNDEKREGLSIKTLGYAQQKLHIIDDVMNYVSPYLGAKKHV